MESFELRKAKQLSLVDPDMDSIRIRGAQTYCWKLALRTNRFVLKFTKSRALSCCKVLDQTSDICELIFFGNNVKMRNMEK